MCVGSLSEALSGHTRWRVIRECVFTPSSATIRSISGHGAVCLHLLEDLQGVCFRFCHRWDIVLDGLLYTQG